MVFVDNLDLKYNNHDLIDYKYSFRGTNYTQNHYICKKCMLVYYYDGLASNLNIKILNINIKSDLINEDHSYNILTCEELIIKNIIE